MIPTQARRSTIINIRLLLLSTARVKGDPGCLVPRLYDQVFFSCSKISVRKKTTLSVELGTRL